MEKTTVLENSRSQAVRLLKTVVLPEGIKHIDIIAVGRACITAPVDENWGSWFDGESMTSDFMTTREQLSNQDRGGL